MDDEDPEMTEWGKRLDERGRRAERTPPDNDASLSVEDDDELGADDDDDDAPDSKTG